MAKKETTMFEAPVEFGKLSIGEESASIRCKFSRERLSLDRADALLCNRRLIATLATGDGDEQQLLFDDMNEQISGVFEAKSFSVKADAISATLTITLSDVKVELFSHFAGRKGVVRIEKAEEIEPDDPPSTPPVEDGDSEAPKPEVNPDGWKRLAVSHLGLPISYVTALAEHEKPIKTLGRLSKHMNDHGIWWAREINGIGDVAKEKIEAAWGKFWAEHPEYAEPLAEVPETANAEEEGSNAN